MGKSHSVPRIYAKFEGEPKVGESRILRHSMTLVKPDDPETMLEELEYTLSLPHRIRLKKHPDVPFLGTRERHRTLSSNL